MIDALLTPVPIPLWLVLFNCLFVAGVALAVLLGMRGK